MAVITTSNLPAILATQNNALLGPGALRESMRVVNALVEGLANMLITMSSDGPVTSAVPTIGTTVTMATPAQTILIGGAATLIAAETAKAFGALGTIPASTFGIIAIDRVAAATTTFVSGAANYTTGYATAALALAAAPAKTANKARTGLILVGASASGWVAGTDALAGGTGGNPASTTQYLTQFVGTVNQGLGYTDLLFWQTPAILNSISRLANTNNSEYAPGVY